MPSLRERKRYLVFEVISKGKVSFNDLSKSLIKVVHSFLGELESAKANIKLLPDKWDREKQEGIIRINRKYVNHVKAALCLITKIKNRKVIIRSIWVSGILKKTAKFVAQKGGC